MPNPTDHGGKETANETRRGDTSNNVKLGAGTSHYYSLSDAGHITLHSEVKRTSGRGYAGRSDTASNDILILSDGRVLANTHDNSHGGQSGTRTISGQLEKDTVKAIAEALGAAQESGGLSKKEDLALNNLRTTINKAVQDGRFDARDNQAILNAVAEVNKAAHGQQPIVSKEKEQLDPTIGEPTQNRTAQWDTKKGARSSTSVGKEEDGQYVTDSFKTRNTKEVQLSRTGHEGKHFKTESVHMDENGYVVARQSQQEHSGKTNAVSAKGDHVKESTADKIAKAMADAERSGGISADEVKALNRLRETIGKSLVDGNISASEDRRIAHAAENVSKASNKGYSR